MRVKCNKEKLKELFNLDEKRLLILSKNIKSIDIDKYNNLVLVSYGLKCCGYYVGCYEITLPNQTKHYYPSKTKIINLSFIYGDEYHPCITSDSDDGTDVTCCFGARVNCDLRCAFGTKNYVQMIMLIIDFLKNPNTDNPYCGIEQFAEYKEVYYYKAEDIDFYSIDWNNLDDDDFSNGDDDYDDDW